MLLAVEIVTVAVAEPLAGTVRLETFKVTVGPVGLTATLRVTEPVKLLTLVIVTVDVAEEPALMLRLLGLTVVAKSGAELFENVAFWTLSGSGVGVPLAIVTHVFGDTLVFEHPVWNPRGMPEVVAVTL